MKALKAEGIPGRLAMLRAVQSDNDAIGSSINIYLDNVLVDDVYAGRDIKPVIEAAVDVMGTTGKAGKSFRTGHYYKNR